NNGLHLHGVWHLSLTWGGLIMRWWTHVRMLTVLLVVTGLGVGLVTQAPAGPASPRRGGTLRIAQIGEPPTLDNSATTVGVTSNIAVSIFETLFAFDTNWVPRPLLAESSAISQDGRTHTIKLRQNVLFHNGREMTAEDVAASLIRWGKVGSRGAVVFQQVESVRATDKYTVVIQLKEPFAPLYAFLALPSSMAAIMPKEIADAAPAGPVTEYVGTGPYRFVEWIPNRHVKLTRWDRYVSRTEPASLMAGRRDALADDVIFYPVGNVATRIAGVQTGDYDLADSISTDLYDQLRRDARVVPEVVKPGTWLVFFFNKRAGLMANVKLRQAVLQALRMQPILQVTIGDPDLYELTPSIYPKGTPWYSEAGASWYNLGNVDRAKALAAEAGYRGEPIRWLTTLQYDWMFKSTTVAAAQLRQAGFNINQQVYEWAGVVERRARPAEWEMFTTGHGFVPDPALIDVFSPTYPGWWDSPAKTQLFNDFNRTIDTRERQRIWHKLQELVFTEGGWVKTGDFFILRLRSRNTQPQPGYVWSLAITTWNISVAR
ncbi:MAG: ABC transporter substrate-binding protein, partial [Armatimonadota bacterium]|nr:ABC transporter substrate-binding protein [Armatimonadota bacterium]